MNLPPQPLAEPSARTASDRRELTPSTDPGQLLSSPVSRRPANDSERPAGGKRQHEHLHDATVEPHTADGVPRPRLRREDYAHIAGWGADLDRAQRPAVPMERMPARLEGVPPVQQQALNVEVLHSNERPGLTPVFGTSVPPRGISGSMRRLAFRFSENDVRHWLTLLAADRVHVVEGVLSDLARGHVPNIYAEMGGRAELKHNPAGAAKKAAVVGLVVVAAFMVWRRRARR